MREAQILGACLPSFNSQVFTQLNPLSCIILFTGMLCSPQPKIKLHHLIPKNESLTGTDRASQVSPGVGLE